MAMVYFKSVDGKTNISLDIETDIQVSLPSTVSKTSNMSGIAVSDDVIEGNANISVNGVVTYSKLSSQENNLNPIQLQEALQESRRNRTRFTLYVKDYGQPLLKDYDDCVISNVDVSVGKYSDSINVSLSFEQVFVSQAAKATYLAPKSSESAKPTTANTKDSSDGSKTHKDEKGSRTIVFAIKDFFSRADRAQEQLDQLQSE